MSLTYTNRACPLLFYSVLVSVSAFMALSTVFYSINSPDNSLLSHSVLPVLFLPHLWLTGLKAPTNILTVRFGGLPSRSEGVAVNVFDINQPSLPTPFLFCSCVCFCPFMALSTVFHSINSPDNSPLSHFVLSVSFLPYRFFKLYSFLFMKISFSPDIILCG